MNIDGGCCIISLALTVNCITSIVDGALKITRHFEEKSSDYYSSVQKIYIWLESTLSPILKRVMVLECVICLVLAFLFCPDHLMIKNKVWLIGLFLPQIILIFYCLLMEFVLICRMAYLDSAKYNLPSYQRCIECIFKLILYSFVNIILPSEFNKICQKIFGEIKNKQMENDDKKPEAFYTNIKDLKVDNGVVKENSETGEPTEEKILSEEK